MQTMRKAFVANACLFKKSSFHLFSSSSSSAAIPASTISLSVAKSSATSTSDGGRPIYLDVQSTSPVDPRVLDAMLPYFGGELFGNPHSRTHRYGWESESAAELARQRVADVIGADPKEIIFTSGATESNNMVLKGVPEFYKKSSRFPDGKVHVITTQTEHKCVIDSARYLEDFQGVDVTYLGVNEDGLISLDDLKAAVRPNTILVSVMAVNNEIGVIQPLKEISDFTRSKGIFFHTDAAQAFGKIPLSVKDLQIDFMSISGHKVYGPKGVGALYVRRRPRARLVALFSGGGQERGLRSGTLPTPLVVGFGAASAISKSEMQRDAERIANLSNRLYERLLRSLSHVKRNGSLKSSYPGCLNISFEFVEGESLLMALKDIALSSGSACTSASLEPSYVLRALGSSEEAAHSSIRFGIGRFTTEEEIDYTAEATIRHVNKLRDMSPLWEMIQEGIDLKSINWTGATEH